jgi:16S rRNA (guanine1207-N2)-methyltransferase
MSHYFSEKQDSRLTLKKIQATIRGKELIFYLASGVFSSKHIDKGSLLLAETAEIGQTWDVLDLGCGNGAVGIAVAKAELSSKVVCSDINERAVKAAKLNIKLNNVQNAEAVKSDGFEKLNKEFDTILLNPPQTAGRELCQKLIASSKAHLKPGGSLQLVARHNKGGKTLYKFMQEIFQNGLVLSRSGGYRVYMCKNA